MKELILVVSLLLCSSLDAANITLGIGEIEDTYVYANVADSNYSTNNSVRADPSGTLQNMIYKLDLSGLPAAITVDSISFRMFKTTSTFADDLFFHQVTQNVVITECTWNDYSTGNAWTSAGGDYEVKTDSLTNHGFNGSGDVTDSIFVQTDGSGGLATLIEGWSNGTTNNYGFLITTDASSYYVSSTEDGASITHPYLYIEYTEVAAGSGNRVMIRQ